MDHARSSGDEPGVKLKAKKAWVISMGLQFGRLVRWVLAGAALTCASLSTTTCASAGADDLDLFCTGNSYTKDGPFPTLETFSLKITGTKPVTVMIGQIGSSSDKPVKARIMANNIYQLKFVTGKFTGEYFHDARLISLLCKPSWLDAKSATLSDTHVAPETTGLSLPTIKRAESDRDISVSAEAIAAIRRAPEKAGIEFLDGDEPGVKLKAKGKRNEARTRVLQRPP
jgi:hypothetical protein